MLTLPFTLKPSAQETNQLAKELSMHLDALLTVEDVGVYAEETFFSQFSPELYSPATAMAIEQLKTAIALTRGLIESDVQMFESRIKKLQQGQEKQAS